MIDEYDNDNNNDGDLDPALNPIAWKLWEMHRTAVEVLDLLGRWGTRAFRHHLSIRAHHHQVCAHVVTNPDADECILGFHSDVVDGIMGVEDLLVAAAKYLDEEGHQR